MRCRLILAVFLIHITDPVNVAVDDSCTILCACAGRSGSILVPNPSCSLVTGGECPAAVHPDVKGFGQDCKYRCNCKDNEQCDEVTGDCPTDCLHGWMGPGCQYRNYATMLSWQNVQQHSRTDVESDYAAVAIDGDVSTCSRTGPGQSRQQWWRAEFNSSLYIVGLIIRIPHSQKGRFKGFSVEIGNSTDNLDLCYKHGVDVTGEETMNVNCVTPMVGEVLEIRLAENQPPPLVLCEIEIFGGRLISFHRPTSIESVLNWNGAEWPPSAAVDGRPMANASENDHYGRPDTTCAVTLISRYIKTKWWEVQLENVYNIQGINCFFGYTIWDKITYSVMVSDSETSGYKNISIDDQSNDVNDFYFKSYNYTMPIPGSIVRLERSAKNLAVCEVEVFGDCPLGKCGWECNVTCMCISQTTGKAKIEGTCPYECRGRWTGQLGMCNIECSDTLWGPDCNKTCGHCKNNMACNLDSGICPESCEPGWKAPFCVDALQCPKDTDIYGIAWGSGIQGQYMQRACPEGYKSGWVTRLCGYSGQFHEPVYNCTQAAIEDIYRKVFEENAYINGTTGILDELLNATSVDNHILMIGDIEKLIQIMKKITEVLEVDTVDINKTTDSFVEVVSNMFGEDAKLTWEILINMTGSGADAVIDILDLFMEKIATAKGTDSNVIAFAKPNLLIKLDVSAVCEKNVNFPDMKQDEIPAWAKNTGGTIDIPCTHEHERRSFSLVMYRNLSEILPSWTSDNRSTSLRRINAPVMSLTLFPRITSELERPVEITFDLFDTSMENPICTFWKKNNGSDVGYWSNDGCWLSKYDKKKNTVCKCNHLTNFAVLMSPSSITEKSHVVILGMISMIGCITSMTCLSLTLFIYVIFWRSIKSFTTVINVNLTLALFVAYLIFLAGIDQTKNKVICTSIAVSLHLVYLVVFFIMLTEGLILAYSVYKPFSTNRPVKPLLIASHVVPCIIVGISMGVVQLEGYGSNKFCWLSTDSGLIWAFTIPVLTIILVNLVIIGLAVRTLCGTVAMSRKTDSERTKAGIRSVLVLMPITGVTWVFGIFSVNEETVVFQYLFAIFNSLQITECVVIIDPEGPDKGLNGGVLIFVFHCVMNKQIQKAFKRALGRSKMWSSQATETQMASTEPKISKPADI